MTCELLFQQNTEVFQTIIQSTEKTNTRKMKHEWKVRRNGKNLKDSVMQLIELHMVAHVIDPLLKMGKHESEIESTFIVPCQRVTNLKITFKVLLKLVLLFIFFS